MGLLYLMLTPKQPFLHPVNLIGLQLWYKLYPRWVSNFFRGGNHREYQRYGMDVWHRRLYIWEFSFRICWWTISNNIWLHSHWPSTQRRWGWHWRWTGYIADPADGPRANRCWIRTNFSEVCREKFKDYPRFSILTGKFEDTAFDNHTYDFIFSASAFHWVPEEIGYPKVFSRLKSGGVFSRFANHPFRDKGNPALAEEINGLWQIILQIP